MAMAARRNQREIVVDEGIRRGVSSSSRQLPPSSPPRSSTSYSSSSPMNKTHTASRNATAAESNGKNSKKRKEKQQCGTNGEENGVGDYEEAASVSGNFAFDGSTGICFPMSRVQRIIRNHGDLRLTKDAVFVINKATEYFLKQFAEDSFCSANEEEKCSLVYVQLASTVRQKKQYEFLSDFVPEKIKAKDALSHNRTEEK